MTTYKLDTHSHNNIRKKKPVRRMDSGNAKQIPNKKTQIMESFFFLWKLYIIIIIIIIINSLKKGKKTIENIILQK